MKLSKILYIIPAAAALTMSSCAHFLDTPTDTRVEVVTTEQLRMLMNSAYPQGNYAWPCELMSDNMEDNNTPDADGLRYNLSAYNRGDDEMFRFELCVSSTDSETPSGIWENHYNSIASANAVLQRLAEIEQENGGTLDATQSAIRGEALMLRAYCHFILAQVFCEPYAGPELSKDKLGVPYITAPEVTVKPHYERGTMAETYAKIQADIEAGLPLIDNTLYTIPKYHFNIAAAHAFAARFYLFTRQYKRAYNCANIAFGAPRTDNLDTFDPASAVDASGFLSNVWSNFANFYYLSDVGLYQNGIDKASNFMLYATYSTELRHISGGRRYGVIRNALNATLHGSSPVWRRFTWSQSNGKGGSFTMHPCFNGCCYINGKSEYGLFNGTNISEQFEYTDKVAGIGYCHITRREFFGEETLLVRAEARLFLGDKQGALDDLTTWETPRRNCPGAVGHEDTFADLTFENIRDFYETNVPADPEAARAEGYGISKPIHIDEICPESDAVISAADANSMLQCIQHFRRIETLHMGMRWFDIKRLGLEYTRYVGKEATAIHLGVHDLRKAVQIPAEVSAAGMQPNPRLSLDASNGTEKVVPNRREI